MKRLIVALILLTTAPFASTGSFADFAQAKALTQTIMQHFIKEDFVGGLNLAKPYWPLPTAEVDELAMKTKFQWRIVKERFGSYQGMELIKEEKIGTSFVRLVYLHKFENHAIYWKFTFYNPNGAWKVNSINFKDDIGSLF